ncbi:MAG TPA: metallophosphoesterase [Longimicrobium sp.]|jgi:hypothetical protein
MNPHREEFLQLAHVSHDRALIAWGAFFFKPDGDRHKLVDHDDLVKAPINRKRGCIGAETESYGPATVRVWRLASGARVEPPIAVAVEGHNHAWVQGLQPNTAYEYEVTVSGKAWGGSPRDLSTRERTGRFTPAEWRYQNRFTTFPAPDGPPVPITFAVLGDPGTGKDIQYEVAAALEKAVSSQAVRFVITTGDNIYAQGGLLEKAWSKITGDEKSSGNEDDDWFDTYFHPYRRIINRVPVFPCLGNHDTAESENEADLNQHMDNFYLAERFPAFAPRWKNGHGAFHTMFYRFRCGPDLEMIAIDTGRPSKEPAFERPAGKAFIDEVLKSRVKGWQIPFSHHPPFSIGPSHDHEPNVQNLANLFTGLDGYRLWLSGHEHNWQHHRIGNVHFVVSGASGKLSKGVDEKRVHPGASCCHSEQPHFLLVTVNGPRLTLRAIGRNGADIERKQLADLPPHPAAIEITR